MGTQAQSLLMVMNPGFNRTFASIVDTAHCLGQHLIMVECSHPEDEYETGAREDEDMPDGNHPALNPWDQDVSMLNITTKTFGAGERGWVGRTVNIRRIAQRWFAFRKLEHVKLS
ncbi:hypothetical protein E4T47_06623 [Aureobasidium subglaciale]|nr:hypothetical protein E4T43_06773 [Aureobasidium subglaciale]KAI5269949.1 hypothetical protein E4T47_06623 [Aureobasidium subglaciale]